MQLPPVLAGVLINQIRRRGVRSVPSHCPTAQAIPVLGEPPHCLLVVQPDGGVGRVTHDSLRQALKSEPYADTVGDFCEVAPTVSVERLASLSTLLLDTTLLSQAPLVVVAEGQPLGVLLLDDLRQVLTPATLLQHLSVQDVTGALPIRLAGQTTAMEVARQLAQQGAEAVVGVVEGNVLRGWITASSLLAQIGAGRDLQSLVALDLLEAEPLTVALTDSLQLACDRIFASQADTIGVTDEWGGLCGVLVRSHLQALCHPWIPYPVDFNQAQAQQIQQLEQQRAELEQRLAYHESRYRAIVEQAPIGISHADTSGQILQVNQQLCDMLGYSKDELLAMRYQEFTHPDDRGKFTREVEQVATGERPVVVLEKRYLRKDGAPIWVQVTLSCLHEAGGSVVSDLAIVENIEERKQAEAARRLVEVERLRSEAQQQTYLMELSTWRRRYEAAGLASGQVLFEFDIQTQRDVWSPNTEAMFGYRPEEMPSGILAFIDQVHPEDRAALRQLIENDVTTTEPYRLEYRYRCRDGTYKWVEERGKTCYDDAANPLYVIGLITDVSDRKQAELELSRAKAAADAANWAKSAFLANMSHELRTPLNIILGFTQILQQDVTLAPRHQKTLETILQSGDHLLSLINDVLHVSKIEANQVELKTSELALVPFLRSLETMLQAQATAQGLELITQLAADLPTSIEVDQNRLRQILINLLGNAIKFTETGQVQLVCSPTGLPSDELRSPDQIWLRFEVHDTGPGIPDDELEAIFEPFTQIHGQHRLAQGTGLGLTISRQYAHLMGGHLTIESQLGQGSTFTLLLPVRPLVSTAAPPSPAGGHLRIAPGQPTHRVLIVDDVASNRLVVAKLLNPLQWPMQEAANGQEAIEIWQQWRPDLIWMDLRMPVMDGYEAIRRIRQLEQAEFGPQPAGLCQQAHRPARIIVMTAGTLEDEIAKSIAIGCDDVILKPLRQPQLLELLDKHLQLDYTYDTPSTAAIRPSAAAQLTTLLAQQPSTWVRDLYYAALCCDHSRAKHLLQARPPNSDAIVEVLQPLLYEFRFEDLTRLLQPFA